MQSDDEDQDKLPDINHTNQNNLSHNLLRTPNRTKRIQDNDQEQESEHDNDHKTSSNLLIKVFYTMTSVSVSLLGIYIISIYPILQSYSTIYFYFFIYSFIWPIAIFITIIIVKLYTLFHSSYEQAFLHQLTSDISTEANTSDISTIMLIIFIILFYFFSIPHTICFVFKLITIRHLFILNDLYLFTAFLILNILSSVIFYLFAFSSYTKAKSTTIIIGEDQQQQQQQFFNDTHNEHSVNKKKKHRGKRDDVNMIINNDFLKKIELEVLQSQKISGIIEPNAELININNYFNKQAVSYISPSPPVQVREMNEISPEFNSFRSRGSITSINEIDYNAIEKEKREQQKEFMKRKIKLNILTEEDEEDTRKNELIAKMNRELKSSKFNKNYNSNFKLENLKEHINHSFEYEDNNNNNKNKERYFDNENDYDLNSYSKNNNNDNDDL